MSVRPTLGVRPACRARSSTTGGSGRTSRPSARTRSRHPSTRLPPGRRSLLSSCRVASRRRSPGFSPRHWCTRPRRARHDPERNAPTTCHHPRQLELGNGLDVIASDVVDLDPSWALPPLKPFPLEPVNHGLDDSLGERHRDRGTVVVVGDSERPASVTTAGVFGVVRHWAPPTPPAGCRPRRGRPATLEFERSPVGI